MKLKVSKLLLIVLVGICVGLGTRQVYQTELTKAVKARESHDLCHDTPTQLAWVSYRDGEARCFLEYREYPHKVKAAYIDDGIN